MPSRAEIIEALTINFVHALNPVHTTGSSRLRITYQFENTTPPDNFTGYTNWRPWSSSDRAEVRKALAHVETFLNIDFVEVTGASDPDVNLGRVPFPGLEAGLGGPRVAYSGHTIVDFDGFALYDSNLSLAGRQHLILHELGHALGLDHPFEGVRIDPRYDNSHYSVMSYTADPHSGTHNDAMMLYDVYALQQIWGAASHNTGNSTYRGPRNDTVDVIWDTGGTDTFDATGTGHGVKLDLREGRFSTFGSYEDVAIAYGVKIEIAKGWNSNDTLTGNASNNKLFGRSGDDRIDGKPGHDLIRGAGGRDLLYGGDGRDTLGGGGSHDTVYGGNGRDVLIGGMGTDKLWGGSGADTFRYLRDADRDYIRDFEPGIDKLEIQGKGSLDDVLAAGRTIDGHTRFFFGGDDILTVRNVTLDQLADDILIS